jgi:DNA processing protein
VLETLRPLAAAARVQQPATPFRPEGAEADETERRYILDLLSPTPVAVDEIIRQAGLPAGTVHTVLLEFELAGRLERHAGGRVALAG